MDAEKQLILTFAKDIALTIMKMRQNDNVDFFLKDFENCIPRVKKIFDKLDNGDEGIFARAQ